MVEETISEKMKNFNLKSIGARLDKQAKLCSRD